MLYRGSQCTEMVLFCRREHTATAALLLNNSVCVCALSSVLFQPVCQAVTAALMECWLNSVTETHRTMAIVGEPDLSWKKLKCFACSLHGLVLLYTSSIHIYTVWTCLGMQDFI